MNNMKKLLVSLWFSILLLVLGGALTIASASGSRMLQGIAGPDQDIKQARGLPVIVSNKNYYLALMPESMFSEMKDPVRFTLIIENSTEEPWHFSMKDLKVYSESKDLEIIGPEMIVAEARKKFSREEYKINKEQAKALAPYVENKMQNLQDSLLKTGIIPPGRKIKGFIYVEVPQGTEMLTIEVIAPGEVHKFSFKVIEL